MNPFSSRETPLFSSLGTRFRLHRALILFALLTTHVLSAQKPTDTIRPVAFNEALVEQLIRQGVDSVRKSKGLNTLAPDSSLYMAAADQAAFLQYQRTISHRQPDDKKIHGSEKG